MEKKGRRDGSSSRQSTEQMQSDMPALPAVRPPVLRFDVSEPLLSGTRRPFVDVEDPALTAFVTTLCDELYSPDAHPTPTCPRCGDTHTHLHSRKNNHRTQLPVFRCNECKHYFTRLTGSPFAHVRFPERLPAFIRLLPQAIPVDEAARRLDLNRETVCNHLMRFRQLIEKHDPDGHWIPRVRLGIRYRPHGTCRHCGYSGQLASSGFDGAGRKRALCPECNHSWTITRDDAGMQIAVSIAHDPALTAVRRRRRKGFPAPDLVRAEKGVLTIPSRPQVSAITFTQAPEPEALRFDFTQPLSSKRSTLPRRHSEDTELTGYLRAEIDKVFSPDIEPIPHCPHCGGSDARFTRRHNKPPCLPEFQCATCMRRFTRPTGTPMVKMRRKDMLEKLLPLLSQHVAVAQIAGQLEVTSDTIIAWIKLFRSWLLKLDPTGHYERRVRLGLKSPWPVLTCPKCEVEAPAKPCGFLQRKSIPYGQVRLFRCSACNRHFNVPVDALSTTPELSEPAEEP
ncbi:DUF746 domain-containing protein [Paraburkholderia adhaesiva]|uniref:DUF746 domain-containing protein n=1 Tax=Paraburkholderia adhaesiva TaxID=2883244 RepID=UPI001F37A7AE|nr:DUF746 domain-containing protein [Paraburkholderia adhaesiva]